MEAGEKLDLSYSPSEETIGGVYLGRYRVVAYPESTSHMWALRILGRAPSWSGSNESADHMRTIYPKTQNVTFLEIKSLKVVYGFAGCVSLTSTSRRRATSRPGTTPGISARRSRRRRRP